MRAKGEALAASFDGRGSQRRLQPHVGVIATSHLVLGKHGAWKLLLFLALNMMT